MLKNPRLKYNFHAEFLDEDKILLSSETESIFLSGKPYYIVLSAIQQNRGGLDELMMSLQGKLSEFEILYILNVLESKGYLTEAAPGIIEEECAFWNSNGMDMETILRLTHEKTVYVDALGSLDPLFFIRALDSVGLNTLSSIEYGLPGAIEVVFTDDYRGEELRKINNEALRTKTTWMLVKPVGVELWIGPIFIPGKTGCWECLEHRLNLNNPHNTFYKAQKHTEANLRIPTSSIYSSLQIASNMAALAIIKWLYFEKNNDLEGKIITFDTRNLTTQSHTLVKRPQCSACGNKNHEEDVPRPIILEPKSTICISTAGGYRDLSPEETLEKYQHHVSPITGIVKYLKPYHTIKNAPVYNYSSGPNTAVRSKSLYWLNSHVRSSNGGKGRTLDQAKAGALCEAIERYSMMYQGDEPFITGSLDEIGPDAIHPNKCMNYSDAQYRDREAINNACRKFYSLIPIPFDPTQKMQWTPVYSLTEQRFKYLPSCFCYAQYPAEDELKLFSYPDSNGNAAGNSIEEAILQGFLELVERDSVALWWYNRLQKPAVDLDSFNDPYFIRLKQYYQSIGRSLYVLDITSDLKIPSFVAVSHRPGDSRQDIVFGLGSHVDVRIALERSLIELNQILPIVEAPGTDRTSGKYLTEDITFIDWLKNATLENQPYLEPLKTIPAKRMQDYSPLCEPTIYHSVNYCIDAARKNGMETLVLDLTRKDIEVPVAKVIVPGMRHFWKRLAPGRLYDVPVKMGWLDTPLREEDMNPIGVFI